MFCFLLGIFNFKLRVVVFFILYYCCLYFVCWVTFNFGRTPIFKTRGGGVIQSISYHGVCIERYRLSWGDTRELSLTELTHTHAHTLVTLSSSLLTNWYWIETHFWNPEFKNSRKYPYSRPTSLSRLTRA